MLLAFPEMVHGSFTIKWKPSCFPALMYDSSFYGSCMKQELCSTASETPPFTTSFFFFLNWKSQPWKHFEHKLFSQMSKGVFNWHHHGLNFTPYVWPCFVKCPAKWGFPHNCDIWDAPCTDNSNKGFRLGEYPLTDPRCHSMRFKIPRNKCSLCLSLEQGNVWKGTGHI